MCWAIICCAAVLQPRPALTLGFPQGTSQKRVEYLTSEGGLCEDAFVKFLEGIRASVRGEVEVAAAQQMIAQHIVTIPVFDAMLGKNEFSQHNPVSKEIERLLVEFKAKGVSFSGEIKPLTRAYQNMSEAFEGAVEGSARLDILRQIYDGFFKEAMQDEVKRLGIVYTPVEIVDFMVRSAAAICQKEFSRSLSDENVHILDPFCGTGTFLTQLLELRDGNGEYIIGDEDLDGKYHHELHANELVLLAYYIAALKIEEARHTRDKAIQSADGSDYEPFEQILLTDTLLPSEKQVSLYEYMNKNIQGRFRQDQIPMMVIMSNPPWSSGQKSAGDDNPNTEYDEVGDRIDDTYGAKHREVTGKSRGGNASGNLYVKALRWATDRILPTKERDDNPAIIGLVHPNSVTDGTSLAGVRATMREEFSDIYVVNLRGNAYKAGEEFRKEGDKIFGAGSRNGVQITFLVRNPNKDLSEPATLHYAQVPDRMSLEKKFQWLADLSDVTNPQLNEVPVTPQHDWINLGDGSYEKLLPVCDTDKSNPSVASSTHASGVKTNCDTYVYSFNRHALEEKIQNLIFAYNEALDDVEYDLHTVESATQNDQLEAIKWTDTLKTSLKQEKKIEFEPWRIREVLYRPFTKLWLYEDDRILSSVSTVSKMFPRDEEIESVGFTGGSGRGISDSVFASDTLSDLNNLRGGVHDLSPDGDPNNQRQQHDFPDTRDEPADRSSGHQGIPTDQGDTASEIDGGGVLRSPEQQFSSCATPNSHSQPSRPTLSQTSTSPDAQPATSPDINSDNDSVKRGESDGTGISSSSGPSLPVGDKRSKSDTENQEIDGGGGLQSHSHHNPIQQGNLRNSREQNSRRPLRSRNSTSQPSNLKKTIILTGPSNMAIFGTLATLQLPDLHSMAAGQQTRVIPRAK